MAKYFIDVFYSEILPVFSKLFFLKNSRKTNNNKDKTKLILYNAYMQFMQRTRHKTHEDPQKHICRNPIQTLTNTPIDKQ